MKQRHCQRHANQYFKIDKRDIAERAIEKLHRDVEQPAVSKPWIAYSWLFDITMQFFYRPFGYVAFVYFEVLVRVALAVALFHLVRSLLPRFWRAVAITGVALYAMSWV